MQGTAGVGPGVSKSGQVCRMVRRRFGERWGLGRVGRTVGSVHKDIGAIVGIHRTRLVWDGYESAVVMGHRKTRTRDDTSKTEKGREERYR
jgi:hypothetical protein